MKTPTCCPTKKYHAKGLCHQCYQKQHDGKTKQQYYKNNRKARLQYSKTRWGTDKERIKEIQKRYYQTHKKKISDRQRRYYEKHRIRFIKLAIKNEAKRYKNSLQFRIASNLRRRFRLALKDQNTTKELPVVNLIGCSVEYFKLHLEKQFKVGMSWSNYGFSGWHMDHIQPCVSFDVTNTEEQKKCFHYTNMQPLWSRDNLSKGAKV